MELIIVVIVIGVLAGLALPMYLRAVERGRASEAYNNLGVLYKFNKSYDVEYGAYTTVDVLNDKYDLNIPSNPSGSYDCSGFGTHYFRYSCNAAESICQARRCIEGGKHPPIAEAAKYQLKLYLDTGEIEWINNPGD